MISYQDFVEAFPEFSAVSEAVYTPVATRSAVLFPLAGVADLVVAQVLLELYTAHVLSLSLSAQDQNGGTGLLKSVTSGQDQKVFVSPNSSDFGSMKDWFSTTTYGAQINTWFDSFPTFVVI